MLFELPDTAEFPLSIPEPVLSPFHERLRNASRFYHDEVDGLYGQFDLRERGSYGDFLASHARALLPLENWLDLAWLVQGVTPRSPALRADLETLGRPLIEPAALGWKKDGPALWGAAYVVEGSRLGAAVLHKAVAPDVPIAYLSSTHPQGAWRAFLRQLDAKAAAGGERWQTEAVASAIRTFTLFADAAVAWGAVRGR
ncbi:MAG: biliverdin-producing heme oxygenase [Candidatus Andeanibacterium colombiense]|uniref:Biliverdin-producing heme oxygenase n=1 Tax=Candidatus Andeanibacterium colombiense TaxID=3121345 RepID=A0AAJ5X364_9SPHN|nr:MAG: biliverdin-producing heme oxygenase [Sphingomonadaceae bacterium]